VRTLTVGAGPGGALLLGLALLGGVGDAPTLEDGTRHRCGMMEPCRSCRSASRSPR
jgi:hypothetical protein